MSKLKAVLYFMPRSEVRKMGWPLWEEAMNQPGKATDSKVEVLCILTW